MLGYVDLSYVDRYGSLRNKLQLNLSILGKRDLQIYYY